MAGTATPPGTFLQDIFDRIPLGVAAFDRELRLIEANPTWTGFIERYLADVTPRIGPGVTLDEISPEAAERLTPAFREALQGKTVRLDGLRLDSTSSPSFWDIVVAPLVHDGETVGVIETATDATARVAASEAAREREEQYQQVFAATSDAVIITDLEAGRVVEANPACARMHGYEREEFVGLHPSQFIHPDSFPLFLEFNDAIRAGDTFRCRAMDVRKDGTTFPIEVFGAPVDYGGLPHAVAVVRDISNLLAEEASAAQREAELEKQVEARTHDLEALLALARSASSTLNIEDLLGVILDHLRDLTGYDGAGVSLLEGDRLVQQAAKRADPGERPPRFSAVVRPGDPMWATLRTGDSVVIQDIFSDEPMAATYRGVVGKAIEQLKHVRSWLAVPLRVEGETVGALTLSRATPGTITARDIEIAGAVASQAAAAVENARLFAAAQERSRELGALLSVSRAVQSTLDSTQVLQELLDQLQRVIPYDGCSILTAQDERDLVIVASRAGADQPQVDARGMRFSQRDSGVIWETIRRNETVTIEDVRGEGAFAEAYRTGTGDRLDTTFAGVTSFLAVPLAVQERVFGMLTVSRAAAGRFSTREAELCAGIASQAALALSNAGLFEEAEQRAREMEALSRLVASLSFDQPREQTLAMLAERVLAATDGIACTVTLLDSDFEYRMTGSAGHLPGFAMSIEESVRHGAPSTMHQTVERGKQVLIRNARATGLADPRFAPVHPYFESAEWDTIVLTPLMYAGRALGTLDVYFRANDEPGERGRRFLGAIADQTAVAVENARLVAETHQRLRAAEALSRVASSLTFNRALETTLDVLAENVVIATHAEAAMVTLVRDADESLAAAGTHGLPTGYREALRDGWSEGGRSETMYVYHRQKPQVFQNALERYRSFGAGSRLAQLLDEGGWDIVAAVPIVFRGRSRGAVVAFYPPGAPPDAEELALLKSIGDQAAVGVENTRLFNETEARVRELEALYGADEQLHSSLHLDVVLQSLVDVAVDIVGADKSMLVVLDERTNRLRVQSARGYNEAALDGARAFLQRRTAESLQLRREAIVVSDAEHDPRTVRAVSDASPIGAYVDVPIEVNGTVFGVFNVSFNEPRAFTDADTRLFFALSRRAALAVENARLYERSQHAASLEERQRLARELHDSVSQALYGIALGAKTARTLLDREPGQAREPLDYVMSLAEAGLAELRSMIFELRPESLATEGIVAAFEKQVSALRARHGIEVAADLGAEPPVPIEVKEVAYRVGQEAMHNTAKHARATRIDLALNFDGDELTLLVRDNGQGFDPAGDFPGHLGLKSMAERARNIGGTLGIESTLGEGTSTRLTITTAAVRET